jgi:hypothetical protein
MKEVNLEWTGLANTFDRTAVGFNCYDMQNVRLEGNVLEAEYGYAVQIAEVGAQGYGLGFGRYTGTEEYVASIGSILRSASTVASSWTQLATGQAQSQWEFQQFGPDLYAVNETQGFIKHTIGGSDWNGAYNPDSPTGTLTFSEKRYRYSASYQENSILPLFSGTWTASGDFQTPHPTLTASGDYYVTFAFNKNYGAGTKFMRMALTFSTPQNWAHNDWIEYGVRLVGNLIGVSTDSINLSIVASGETLIPIGSSTQRINAREAIRRFYFLGDRTQRAAVTKIIFDFGLDSLGSFSVNSTFTFNIKLGDVYQNDYQGFSLDVGPTIVARDYAYSIKDVSASVESNLSTPTASIITPTGPTGSLNPGSYTRVFTPNVTGGVLNTSDELRLYRRRLLDGKYVLIGTATNTSSAYVDDKYMEWELVSLDEYGGTTTLPTELKPQVIGKFRGSLGVGIDFDLYLSKISRPIEFEDINSAPDAEDLTQGRSVYVDDQRSEEVNMIRGDNVLYLGTKSKTYVMFGDYPSALTPPRPIANVGPIGKRASWLYYDGCSVLNTEGLWFVKYTDLATSEKIGSLTTQEMSSQIRNSISSLSVNSSSVVVEHRGNLWLFSDTKYLKLDREFKRWTQGTLNHSIVAACPDYSNEMRLLTAAGGLLKFTSGTTFAGSSISWYYETGDQIMPRCRLTGMWITSEGAPTITITAFDGSFGSQSKTYTIDSSEYALTELTANLYGSKFRFRFAGTQADKVLTARLQFEELGESKGR